MCWNLTHIIGEVTQTAESEDEKVDLAHQSLLARPVLGVEVLAQASFECRRHDYEPLMKVFTALCDVTLDTVGL